MLVFVGLYLPCTTLALWLGWAKHFLWDVNSCPDHSVIESKIRGGNVILNAAPHQLDDDNLLIFRAICKKRSEVEELCNQHKFVFGLQPCPTLGT